MAVESAPDIPADEPVVAAVGLPAAGAGLLVGAGVDDEQAASVRATTAAAIVVTPRRCRKLMVRRMNTSFHETPGQPPATAIGIENCYHVIIPNCY